ncbi:MAG TPA: diacylglycerol kinase family protein [Kofleriaceae bacterium]|nr:diacylglycerol kinase family protein [Kofleriaceae bacterium]
MATGVVDATRHIGAIRSAVIIVNDRAPGAHSARWKQLFQVVLGPAVVLTEVRVDHFEGATAAARGAAAWNTDLVIAVGGDGTVNACVNGIGDASTKLAVVPAGTANDLARIACQVVNPARSDAGDWERRDIDAISINGGPRFYSAGGIGWVADVANTANRWRSGNPLTRKLFALIGPVIYTLACVAVILFSRRLGATFRVRYTDAKTNREQTLAFDGYGMMVTNCNRVGKSFHLAPVSEIDDGIFELIVFPRTSRLRLLKAALLAQSKRLFELPEVFWLQVKSAEVELDRGQRFFGDGEILTSGDRFAIELAETPVRLMGPLDRAQPDSASESAVA